MWAIAKIKKKELNIFRKKLVDEFGQSIKFYCPKIQHHKYFKKNVK